MKLKLEDRVKLLEYKFVFEEELQVDKEYQEGTTDLNYRLSFFRNKLDNKHGSHQKEKYDSMFMPPKSEVLNNELILHDDENISQSANKVYNAKNWVKKLYRKIVVITHPDKTGSVQSTQLKDRLAEQYRIAQNAYNQEKHSDLIMVAFDLNIAIPEGVVDKEVTPESDIKKKNINSVKKKIGWQWYHIPEHQKDAELKKILIYHGFEFSEKQVNEVIQRKYIKRKLGTRPERALNKKNKKLK